MIVPMDDGKSFIRDWGRDAGIARYRAIKPLQAPPVGWRKRFPDYPPSGADLLGDGRSFSTMSRFSSSAVRSAE
jgi:hypothetical protein